ncbi:MAG: serine hydrolase [Chthoniobacteraceae bacterium]
MRRGRAAALIGCWILIALTPSEAATKKRKTPAKPSLKKPAVSVIRPPADDDKPRPGEAGKMPKQFRLLQPGEIPLSARGAIVIDGFTGATLYEKNGYAPQYPASTTKILTALLVIEAGDLDREVLVTGEDSKVGESSLSLRPGDRYTRRQMLYGLMLKSANDVAHSLGRDNAGTMEAFALKMTQRARELGATTSSFRNPHGLHHTEHYTSPHDLALITRHAMQQPLFRRIVGTLRFAWNRFAVPGATPELWQLSNHNALLTRFEGCTGVKTGYTNPAQGTLVSAAMRDGREVIACVMHDGRQEKWEDSMLLLTHGLEHPPDGGTGDGN